MTKVRWGLLSTANINRVLIPAIRMSERGELVAVASRNRTTAESYAAEWEIPRAFASYEALLTSDEVDAVYISLPNHLHAEWTIFALEHDKHVLCEKPFALTVGEVDRMIAAAENSGNVLAEAFMYRHHPQTKALGKFLESGRLGDITLVRGTFNFAITKRQNIRLLPETGGGSLWDVGVYPVSMAQYIMGGPPQWVLGDQWLGNSGVDEVFCGQMHYRGARGARMAQITSSLRTPFHTYVEVLGSAGRLMMTRPFTNVHESARQFTFFPAQGEPEEIPVSEQYLYLGEVEDMHAAILDGKLNFVTLTESRNHVRTVVALYESARLGQIVHLGTD